MKKFSCNLNIHYTVPDTLWDKIFDLYKEMPGWLGFTDGIPYWFAVDATGERGCKCINVSVEPSGLSFYAHMDEGEWKEWISLFKRRASQIMGYEIGEPEDGFEFVIY